MIPPLFFDFVVDKPAKTILVYREFTAPCPLVWAAFTRQELLDQWWAPNTLKVQTKIMDFRPGGQWHYAMVGPQGEQQWNLFQYESILPLAHFTARNVFTNAEGQVNPQLPQSSWTLMFTDKGALTQVEIRITYEEVVDLEVILGMGFQEGFAQALTGLDRRLAAWH